LNEERRQNEQCDYSYFHDLFITPYLIPLKPMQILNR
jgi:hypothetical protein